MSGLVGMVNKDLVVSYTIVVSFSHGIGLAAVIWGPLPLFPAFLLSCVVHFIMAVGFPNNIPTYNTSTYSFALVALFPHFYRYFSYTSLLRWPSTMHMF